MLKYQKTCQIILLILGVSMISYGAVSYTHLDVYKRQLLKFVLDDGSGENRVILSGIHDYYEPEELVGKTLLCLLYTSRCV